MKSRRRRRSWAASLTLVSCLVWAAPQSLTDAQAKDEQRAPLDETGGQRIHNPKGGVTWSFGKGPAGTQGAPWRALVKQGLSQKNSKLSSTRLVLHRKDASSAPQGFAEYLPPGYSKGIQWPLLITLHGIGENGDGNGDLHRVIENGIPKVIAENRWQASRPHVVLSPQHDSWGCPRPKAVQKFIDWALAHYPIDPKRVYLAGSSCGANSIWDYLAEYGGQRVAAVIAVGGDGQEAWKKSGCQLGQAAIWGFHGHQDDVIDPAGTHVPLDGLKGCGSLSQGYRKTIYPERGHDAWYRTFGEMSGHDIYEWLLGYTKG